MLLLEAHGLEKSWGDRLLFTQAEPLKLYRGDRLGIVGRNGCGKTTLLRMLAGLCEPDKGWVKRYGSSAVIAQTEDGPGATTLSGGERTRRRIQEALQHRVPILFADEPTSHLDLAGISLVERELTPYDGLVVLISHDRELLDGVCTQILEIEEGKITVTPGGYSAYRELKIRRRERDVFEYEQYAKEKDRLEQAAREISARTVGMRKPPKRMSVKEARLGSEKARQKQAKVHQAAKAIERRMEMLKPVEKPREAPEVRFDVNGFVPLHGKTALRIEGISKRYGAKTLFDNVTLAIEPGSKIALIGPNGAGKSTLLEMIRTEEAGIRLAGSGKIGYFHQTFGQLDVNRSVLDNVRSDSPYPESFIRTVLARLLFRREEVMKPVGVLSGGEKVKTALAKVFLSGCNIMLLDEPTNYLDIASREQLEEVLKAYPGTVLFASHDRRLIRGLASRLLVFDNGGIRLFNGTYSELTEKPMTQRSDHKPDVVSEAAGNTAELRMQLEMELAEVLGRLSVPRKGDVKEEWEARYRALLVELRSL